MGGVNSFDVLEASNLMISTGQDRKVTYWDLRDTRPQRTVPTDNQLGSTEECFALKMKADEKNFLTVGTANIVKLWVRTALGDYFILIIHSDEASFSNFGFNFIQTF